ncbi:8-amino-7-oxononanoate synthase [Salinicola avicenniae]|uniref:8-amino-7-oxononanoate synthase n=1 Tax=Salinicola avicenniae TaxID=2916836 RepID=UPI002073B843|nr:MULTISPECIES: 8-amino-7-oxononanoate synthase [unclassified Salinicola]
MPDLHRDTLDGALQARLQRQRERHRYRERRTTSGAGVRGPHDRLTFCSNDYLGLAGEPRLAEALAEGARRFGTGGGASHLVCGHSEAHERLEQRLATWTGRERALLFSSGYQANLGVISALLGRGDIALHDRLNHASLLDATRLAGAGLERFAHGDATACEQRLAALDPSRRRLVVTDGVFSMDGDTADLPALASACERHHAWLMVDDAHGLGVLGVTGRGTLESQSVTPQAVPVLMGTLGKALGTQGAFVAGSDALIEALIQFSRPYVYTTSLSPALAWATLTSLDLVENEPERRGHLDSLIAHFRREAAGLHAHGLTLMPSCTPIQPLVVSRHSAQRAGDGEDGGNDLAALAMAESLEASGIWCSAIRSPTVPVGSARLRVTLSASHTRADVDRLLETLYRVSHPSRIAGRERS